MISHDFIHIYSKKKLFNAFKYKQSTHPLTHTHTLSFTYLNYPSKIAAACQELATCHMPHTHTQKKRRKHCNMNMH